MKYILHLWICLFFYSLSMAQEPDPYFCLSLQQTFKYLSEHQGTANEEIKLLGFISDPVGFVIDPLSEDIILVGRSNPRVKLSLDDFLVMLRAAFLPDQDNPGVSLEPDEKNPRKMTVKYFGQIQNTNAGKICYEADYLIKQMDVGYPTGSVQIPSPYVQKKNYLKDTELRHRYTSRLFFYPAGAWFDTTENALFLHQCAIAMGAEFKPYNLNVQLGLPKYLKGIEAINKKFAADVTEHFEEMEQLYPVLQNYRSLLQLFALTKHLARRYREEEFKHWFAKYRINSVPTPKYARLIYSDGFAGFTDNYYVEGRAFLDTIPSGEKIDPGLLALRLTRGKANALEEAVLSSRPYPTTRCWSFQVKDRRLYLETSSPMDYLIKQLVQARSLMESGSLQKAVDIYDELIVDYPDESSLLLKRASAYIQLGEIELAKADCDRARNLDVNKADLFFTLGKIYSAKKDFNSALHYCKSALEKAEDPVPIYLLMAQCQLDQNDLSAAEQSLTLLLEKEAYHCEGLWLKAKLLELKKEREKLYKLVNEASNVCPQFANHKKARLSSELSLYSGELKKVFPSLNEVGNEKILENKVGLDVGLNYDQFNYPGSIFIFLPDGAFTIAFPFSTSLIVNNKLKLELVLPFELKSRLALTRKGRAIGLGAGLGNVYAGVYFIPFKQRGRLPFTLLNFHYISGFHKGILNQWFDGSPQIEQIVGRDLQAVTLGMKNIIPFGKLQLVTGLSFAAAKTDLLKSTRPGASVALRFPIQHNDFLQSLSVGFEKQWDRYKLADNVLTATAIRYKLTLETKTGDIIIAPFRNRYPDGSTASFLNVSFNINKYLLDKKRTLK